MFVSDNMHCLKITFIYMIVILIYIHIKTIGSRFVLWHFASWISFVSALSQLEIQHDILNEAASLLINLLTSHGFHLCSLTCCLRRTSVWLIYVTDSEKVWWSPRVLLYVYIWKCSSKLCTSYKGPHQLRHLEISIMAIDPPVISFPKH